VFETLLIVLPQAVLALAGCLFLLAGTFKIAPRNFGFLAMLVLAAASVALALSARAAATVVVPPALRVSALGFGIQGCCLILGAFLVLQAYSAQADSPTAAEFHGMLFFILSGMMLTACANELVLLFVSLELISVPTYVLLYLGRTDHKSQEAATKYFLLSVLSAAVLLYGFAMLYGLAGTTYLPVIRQVMAQTYLSDAPGQTPTGTSSLGLAALVLIVAGLGFKLAAVPFHFYAPDVYEGTSAWNAGLLAVAPKAAGLVALVRVVSESLLGYEEAGQQLLLFLAIVTMTFGNCLALLQSNVRRMLAYSSVAHAGYMLMGATVGFWETAHGGYGASSVTWGMPGGVAAALLYLFVYSLASVGLFGVLVWLAGARRQIDHVDDLTGLSKTHPLIAACAALFLFSLAGIPPLPGFWGKLSVFASALGVRQPGSDVPFYIDPAFALLAVAGVINAAVGAVYYLRLIGVMYLNDPIGTSQPTGGAAGQAAVLMVALFVAVAGLMPRPMFQFVRAAVHSHVGQPASSSLVEEKAGR
jgi:NADH-quinone oxidoreductase subunit N